ncbi:MAG: hypothetical protein H6974_09540 [Gammaproteobacteria bacterium]|nr:hypothetical protein [Gammaproteobacteria bacterium]
MNPWFEEKVSQVDLGTFRAFGILITSRYSKAHELAELLLFAEEAAKSNVNILVKEAFYDSKSNCCEFTLREPLLKNSPEADAVLAAAMKTIRQFIWYEMVFHGGDSPQDEEWLQ